METLMKNKVFLIDTLSADTNYILQHVTQTEIITQREYRNLNITNHSPEIIVTNLLDKVISKGATSCAKFIAILQQEDIQKTFPGLNQRFSPAPTSHGQDNPNTKAYDEVDECYPMTQRPLGHCLIINNHKFHESAKLGDRNGTDADKDALTEVFRRLHFKVEERRDQSSVDMREAVKEFSSKDHSKMDAFVCCILSHGEKGTVFGVDGQSVPIRDLTQPFSHCMTLTGKPKLFFIQACQGNELQRGVWSQDGAKDDECEEDAVKAFGHSVAIEADFLIGMATVESYKSFRHILDGSVFIQELCKQLSEGCREKKDILTIMTRVNRSVSAQDLKCHKQMPEPRYTLTKKLVLPLD